MDTDTTDTTDAAGRRLRHDGWTPARQRAFLEAIAAGATFGDACKAVGLTPSSAYALRDRAAGQAFALGWAAAAHRARAPLADQLLARAVHGQTEWRTLGNGERVERFRFDNGLASRLLARLDAQAEAGGPAQQEAARLVAGEFEAFMDLIGRGDGAAQAGLFLARHASADDDLEPVRLLARADRHALAGAALAAEVDVADLDLGARGEWTADQWRRADAAGLLRPPPEAIAERQVSPLVSPREPDPVWWDHEKGEYRTEFPPPSDFDGDEEETFGHDDYHRQLSETELDMHDPLRPDSDAGFAAAADARDRWFDARARANGVPTAHERMVAAWPVEAMIAAGREATGAAARAGDAPAAAVDPLPDAVAPPIDAPFPPPPPPLPAASAPPPVIPAQAGTQLLRIGSSLPANSGGTVGDGSPRSRG